MAIVFPASPSVNDTFTAGSITYKWDGAKWIGLGVTPADRLVEGSNSLEINASNNLVWSGGDVGIGTDNPVDPLHVLGPDGSSGNPSLSSNNIALFQNDGNTTDGAVITVVAGNASTAQISLGDVDNGNIGAIKYDNSTDSMQFATNSGNRVTINSGGQVLINTIDASGPQNGKLIVRNDVDYSSTEFEDNATLCLQNETNANPATILFHSDSTGGSSRRSVIAGGAAGDSSGEIHFWADASNDTSAASRDVRISPNTLHVYGSEGISAALHLVADEGDDSGDTWRLTSNQDDNDLTISNNVSGSFADKLTIRNDGDVRINDGNLVISTSGHGIDFSANANAAGMTSELLDDYEEGTFEPTFTSSSGDFTSVTYHPDTGARYIKIGSVVTINGCARCTAINTSNRSGSDALCIGGLPFANTSRTNGDNADSIGSVRAVVWGNTNNCPHALQARQNVTFCNLLNYEIDAVTNTNNVASAADAMMVQFSLQYTTA